jgi:hypothetical protein
MTVKFKALQSFRTLGTVYAAQYNIAEDLNPQKAQCTVFNTVRGIILHM